MTRAIRRNIDLDEIPSRVLREDARYGSSEGLVSWVFTIDVALLINGDGTWLLTSFTTVSAKRERVGHILGELKPVHSEEGERIKRWKKREEWGGKERRGEEGQLRRCSAENCTVHVWGCTTNRRRPSSTYRGRSTNYRRWTTRRSRKGGSRKKKGMRKSRRKNVDNESDERDNGGWEVCTQRMRIARMKRQPESPMWWM
jgi:hypothetical protein